MHLRIEIEVVLERIFLLELVTKGVLVAIDSLIIILLRNILVGGRKTPVAPKRFFLFILKLSVHPSRPWLRDSLLLVVCRYDQAKVIFVAKACTLVLIWFLAV